MVVTIVLKRKCVFISMKIRISQAFVIAKIVQTFSFPQNFREDFTSCLAHLPLSYTYFRENDMGTNIFKSIFAEILTFSRKSSRKSAKISRYQLFAQKLYLCFTCWWQAMPSCNNKRKSQHLLIFAKFLPRLSQKSIKIWCLHLYYCMYIVHYTLHTYLHLRIPIYSLTLLSVLGQSFIPPA
jgi:hypothetical protein